MKKNKKVILILSALAIISVLFADQFTKTVPKNLTATTSKKSQQRSIASVEPTPLSSAPQLATPGGLVVLDEKKFAEEAQKDKMSFNVFKNKIAEISKTIGWDLVVEISADGNTHIKNKQVTQEYGTQPLAAYTEEEWVVQEENYIQLVNNSTELKLTRDDHLAIEKWKQSN